MARGDYNRIQLKDVKKIFSEKNYKLLSSEYKNNRDKLRVKCPIGHEILISLGNFKGGKGCPECRNIALNEKFKLDYNEVKETIESVSGYNLVSEEYENYREKLQISCPSGHDFFMSFGGFRSGLRCPVCSDRLKIDTKEAIRRFLERGYYPLLETMDGNNNLTKLPYICPNHPEEIRYISLGNLSKGKGCKDCYIESIKGENSRLWKGGTSHLYLHLRQLIKEWKMDSMKSCNFKCVISGEKFNDIHHLYSFHRIVEETLSDLKIPLKGHISNYTDSELVSIEELFIKKHADYPLGVCLKANIHTVFHKIYGYENNTPEQFLEFKKNISKGTIKIN